MRDAERHVPGVATSLAVVIVAASALSGVAASDVAGQPNGSHATVDRQLTPAEPTIDRSVVGSNGPQGHQADGGTEDGSNETGNASRFEVVEVSPDVAVGETGNLTVAIENVGDELVRDATVTLSSVDSDVRFADDEQATISVGAIEPGEVERVPVGVTVDPTAEQQRYVIDVTVAYRLGADEPRRSVTLLAGFTPGSTQELDVYAEDSSLYVDETGTLRGELANEGNREIDDVVVVLEGVGNGSGLFSAADNRQVLGEILPGRSQPFAFEVDVDSSVEPGPRQFGFRVEYVDEDDRRQRSEVLFEEWTVQERRDEFELRDVGSTLRVDDDGDVTGQLRYQGDDPVQDVVVQLVEPGANATGPLSVTEREYAVDDLETNETTNFSFEVDVSPEAVAGQRQLTFRVQYVDEDGDTERSDPIYAQVAVAEEREVFALQPIDASLQAGSTGVVRLDVTNVGDEPVADVSAKLFVDEPLTADDDEAFVAELAPGESATLTFRVSVADDALAKVYPLSLDFEYEEADGDVELSDTYQVGLNITKGEGDGFLGLPLAVPDAALGLVVGLLVALGAALVVVGRR